MIGEAKVFESLACVKVSETAPSKHCLFNLGEIGQVCCCERLMGFEKGLEDHVIVVDE